MRLALPIALTQLGQVAMMTTDLALIGRLGDGAVAAVALAQLILFSGFVLGMGPMSAVAALASQAFGARRPRMVRRALRVGLWAAVILGIPINVAQLWGEDILLAAGQSPQTAALAARYLMGLTWLLIPGWWFIAIRNFMGAVNRPEPGLWVTLAAIPVNGVLAYALIHGAFGLPRLDLLGAGGRSDRDAQNQRDPDRQRCGTPGKRVSHGGSSLTGRHFTSVETRTLNALAIPSRTSVYFLSSSALLNLNWMDFSSETLN